LIAFATVLIALLGQSNAPVKSTCIWHDTRVALTIHPNVTVERLSDAHLQGTCNDFRTNDPALSCLNGENINTFQAPREFPGVVVVHNGLMGTQCTYATWTIP
jgi:hypothetical protein